jgi:hypothetical protein
MSDRTLRYVVSATDKNASKTIGEVSSKSTKAANAMGASFSKAGTLIGGEVGELASKLGETFDEIGEKGGHGLSAKLAVGGAALVGIGAGLTAMGDKERISTQQLQTAVENTGHSWEDFEARIESVDGKMEHYGFTTLETQDALTKLTNATHDPAKAITLMGEAADLAASRHISLSSASDQLSKLLNGSTRILKSYGIEVQTSADGTKDLAGANAQLATLLHGQADAAANSFTGRLKEMRAEVQDNVAEFGQKYGPAITAAGAAMVIATPVVKGLSGAASAMASKFKAAGVATEETAAATEASAATIVQSDAEIVAANEATAASSLSSKLAMLGVAAAAVGAVYGIDKLVNRTSALDINLGSLDSSLSSLEQELITAKGDGDQLAETWARQELISSGLANSAAKVGTTMDELTNAVTGNDAAYSALIAKYKKKDQKLLIIELSAVRQKYEDTRSSVDKLSASSEKLATEGSSLADVVKELTTDFDKLNSKTIDAEKADIAVKDAIASITKKTIDHSHALTDNTAKGRANLSNVLDAIDASQQHAAAVLKQSGSTDKATASFKSDIDALKQHLIQLGFDKDAVQHLIDKYGQIPKLKKTTVDLKDEATAGLIAIQDQLNAISGGAYTAHVNVSTGMVHVGNGGHSGGGQFASGTEFAPGGRALVAERETEIIDLPRGSRVTPVSKLPRSSSTASQQLDTGGLERKLDAILRELQRSRQPGDVYLDNYKVGVVQGRQADRYMRGG